MMIYNFVKYIQWPANNNSQQFVIGVIGDDEVFNTLNSWYDGKVRGNKTFAIKNFSSAAEVAGCDILYVAKGASNQFDEIKTKLSNAATLIITDKPGLGQKGSGINFKTVNGKLAFEMNQGVIESSKLKVSSQLTAMAIII
ncbi:YfiR family protein [Fulvivirga sp. RKSG066]|nr:YfiR family protein [Fulvivirga aurantia]